MRLATGLSVAALLMGWVAPATAQTGTLAQAAPEQSGTASPSGDRGTVIAQDSGSAQTTDDIVVTGVRASLSSAQSIKRNPDQIVDQVPRTGAAAAAAAAAAFPVPIY